MGSHQYFGRRNLRVLFGVLLLSFVTVYCPKGFAHAMGEGAHVEIDLTQKPVTMQLEITLQELLVAFDIDSNDDGKVTEKEYHKINPNDLSSYIVSRLILDLDGQQCSFEIGPSEMVRESTGGFVRLALIHGCMHAKQHISVNYQMFFDQNPYHQGTLTVLQEAQSALFYFWEDQQNHVIELNQKNRARTLLNGVQLGFYHISIGFDHILFLLSLLLPSVLFLNKHTHVNGNHYEWTSTPSIEEVFIDVVKVVTAFTIAHSVTLTLSVVGLGVSPQEAMIEVAIAITVMAVALNNIFPLIDRSRWIVVALLGLIHGFGFANVLKAYDLPASELGWTLFAFNLGVELGQLLVICFVVPVLLVLRKQPFYVPWVLRGGSVLIFGVALGWAVERAIG